jgi:hypothetical protein
MENPKANWLTGWFLSPQLCLHLGIYRDVVISEHQVGIFPEEKVFRKQSNPTEN